MCTDLGKYYLLIFGIVRVNRCLSPLAAHTCVLGVTMVTLSLPFDLVYMIATDYDSCLTQWPVAEMDWPGHSLHRCYILYWLFFCFSKAKFYSPISVYVVMGLAVYCDNYLALVCAVFQFFTTPLVCNLFLIFSLFSLFHLFVCLSFL